MVRKQDKRRFSKGISSKNTNYKILIDHPGRLRYNKVDQGGLILPFKSMLKV